MTLSQLPGWALAMLERESVARLAFLDGDGRPRVLPITFAVHDDALWSAIDQKPKRSAELARVRWLRARPEAALCVDVYDDDWERLAWVQALGRVEVLETPTSPEALAALAAKYEPYRTEPPPGPLLRLAVERTLVWRAVDRDV